jgi:probable rRNA maturation factor
MRRTRTKRTSTGLPVDIVINSRLWKSQRGAGTILRRAIATAAAMVPTGEGELAVVLTDDATTRALNRQWRGKDEATNVLSFPAKHPHTVRGAPRALGDIVIAFETTTREALAEQKLFRHHLAHLGVHGFLHLLGYDHESIIEAEAMESLEIAILRRLNVPNPYIARRAKR